MATGWVLRSVRNPKQGNMDQKPESPLIAALSFLARPTDRRVSEYFDVYGGNQDGKRAGQALGMEIR